MVREVVDTAAGRLALTGDPGRVWRVGYRPDPWAWTPWQYAGPDGRFPGRWDDPRGSFRTVYAGRELLACLLEVLARFRPDTVLAAELSEIDEDPEDAAVHPTAPGGAVPPSWFEPRSAIAATLTGRYCAVTDRESLPTLRSRFLPTALDLGLPDLDGAALRQSAPRDLTQQLAAWLYDLHDGDGDLVDGVQFKSRHGDGLALWAAFERSTDSDVSERLMAEEPVALRPDTPELQEALRIHRLRLT